MFTFLSYQSYFTAVKVSCSAVTWCVRMNGNMKFCRRMSVKYISDELINFINVTKQTLLFLWLIKSCRVYEVSNYVTTELVFLKSSSN
jgi:hypothetical protein